MVVWLMTCLQRPLRWGPFSMEIWRRGRPVAIYGDFCYSLATMVVRMRHNRSQTKQRRSHHGLKSPALSVCSHCGASHRPHHMCQQCGYYNGRQVLDLESAKVKRDARIKAKEERIKTDTSASAPVAAPAQLEGNVVEKDDTAPIKAKKIRKPKADEDQNN